MHSFIHSLSHYRIYTTSGLHIHCPKQTLSATVIISQWYTWTFHSIKSHKNTRPSATHCHTYVINSNSHIHCKCGNRCVPLVEWALSPWHTHSLVSLFCPHSDTIHEATPLPIVIISDTEPKSVNPTVRKQKIAHLDRKMPRYFHISSPASHSKRHTWVMNKAGHWPLTKPPFNQCYL